MLDDDAVMLRTAFANVGEKIRSMLDMIHVGKSVNLLDNTLRVAGKKTIHETANFQACISPTLKATTHHLTEQQQGLIIIVVVILVYIQANPIMRPACGYAIRVSVCICVCL